VSTARLLHLAAWIVPFGVFTFLLITPEPPKPPTEIDWLVFLCYKAAHASGYAYLTAVGFLIPRTTRSRWGVVALMMSHGIATEVIQASFPELHRHGCIQDVLIDWSGIAVGQYAARLLYRRLTRENRPVGAVADSQPAPVGAE
jgi:VanZ family protein